VVFELVWLLLHLLLKLTQTADEKCSGQTA
jgi:hypothetical protein